MKSSSGITLVLSFTIRNKHINFIFQKAYSDNVVHTTVCHTTTCRNPFKSEGGKKGEKTLNITNI